MSLDDKIENKDNSSNIDEKPQDNRTGIEVLESNKNILKSIKKKDYDLMSSSLAPSLGIGVFSLPLGTAYFAYSVCNSNTLNYLKIINVPIALMGFSLGCMMNISDLSKEVYHYSIGDNIHVEEGYEKIIDFINNPMDILNVVINSHMFAKPKKEEVIKNSDYKLIGGVRTIYAIEGDHKILCSQEFSSDEMDSVKTSYDGFSKERSIVMHRLTSTSLRNNIYNETTSLNLTPDSVFYNTADGLCEKVFEENIWK